MKVAVIPARGGSKRIPRKNIKPFAGKPMIAWSIQAAIDSGVFDRVVVSTDDGEIAEIARHWGAETPFVRPPEISDDHTGTTAVIAHAIRAMAENDSVFEALGSAVCCVYATAPMVRAADIRHALSVLEEGQSHYVFTACEFASPIFRSFRATEDGVEMFFPDQFQTRSQDLPVALHDAGQFYWGRPAAWLANRRVFGLGAHPFPIPRWRVQDIDTADDWTRAELMHEAAARYASTD